MAVDETGADDFTADVEGGPVVISHTHNNPVENGNVRGSETALKHVRELAAAQHQVNRRFTLGRQDSVLESF